MSTPHDEKLPTWLDEHLPPTEAGFSSLVEAYLASASRASFLRELTRLRKEVEVPASFGGGLRKKPRTFEKLAETLLLFEQVLAPVAGRDAAIRRAYQHYIINTDGPIPMRPGAADFDVFAWLAEYAAAMNIALQRIEGPDQEPATLMTIDDPERPARCAAWGAVEGRSSAWAMREAGRLVNFRRYGRNDVISSRLFAIEPRARAHSHANALCLAELSQLVYLREAYVRAQLASLGYAQVRWIQHTGTDTQAVAASHADHAVIVFRGTAGARDILTDMAFRKLPFVAGPEGAPTIGRAHRGFAGALASVWSEVLQAAQAFGPGRPLLIAGHSLGAALAQLAAVRLAAHGVAVAGVYTYGSPRVGDAEFRAAYDAALGKQTFMHVNDEDIVTTIPPWWTGFDHAAQPARRFDKTHKLALDESAASSSREPAPEGGAAEAEAANRELMARVAAAVSESQRYLTIDELRSANTGGMSYGTEFAEGRLDDHGISQYLFKFACAIVDERIAALGLSR